MGAPLKVFQRTDHRPLSVENFKQYLYEPERKVPPRRLSWMENRDQMLEGVVLIKIVYICYADISERINELFLTFRSSVLYC